MALFGRKKKTEIPVDDIDHIDKEITDEGIDEVDEDEIEEGYEDNEDIDIVDGDEMDEMDEWRELDLSKDWREDGPFDISEVDLEADDVKRIDLGSLIVTPEKGLSVQMQSDQATKQGVCLIVTNPPKAVMQVTLFAAPSDEDYCWRLREDFVEASQGAKVVEQTPGPFGTQLRRVVAATDDKGNEGFVAMRDWFVGGPRWVLNARLLGQAALDEENTGAAAPLEDFFRNLVVRRGDVAMVPGTVVPLTAVNPT